MPRFQNTVRNTPLIDLTSFRNTPRMIITQRNTPFTAQFRSMIFGNKQTQETIRYFINTHEKPGKSGFFVAFLRSFHYKMSERFCDTNLKKCFLFFKFRKSKKKYRMLPQFCGSLCIPFSLHCKHKNKFVFFIIFKELRHAEKLVFPSLLHELLK